MSEAFAVDIDEQVCCDQCFEIVSTKWTCPVCGKRANIFFPVGDELSAGDCRSGSRRMQCCACQSEFELTAWWIIDDVPNDMDAIVTLLDKPS